MSSHGSSMVSPTLLFTIVLPWIAIAILQVEANVVERDLYGPANAQFLVGYPDDRDTMETDSSGGQDRDPDPDRDRDRTSASRTVYRAFDSPYGTSFLGQMNADRPPAASKSFGLLPSGRSAFKRNIDEIDRTAFDNFFKRNLDQIDRVNWDGFVKGLADYLASRSNKISKTYSLQVHG